MSEQEAEKDKRLRVLLTGANGFVGRAIAERCRVDGIEVCTTGRTERNHEGLPGYFTADVTAPDALTAALKGVDAVVHAAGLAHQFDKRRSDSVAFMKINADGAQMVARSALKAGVRHFVLISSVSVYGPHAEPVCDENTPCRPQEPYALSKLEAERRVQEIFKETDTCLTILRLATVYGEGDPGNLSRLIGAIDRGRFVWIGRGRNRKSLIHCEDVARATTRVLLSPCEGTGVYNVSAPAQTMREIVEGIATALARPAPKLHLPSRAALAAASFVKAVTPGKSKLSGVKATIEKWLADDVYDGRKFEERFGFRTQVDLSEGLRREVAWYRSYSRLQ
ncbi:MAG: NAD-dependent epimerase/dehydratase family protein [Acidobacteria bacterium]|nr:NAD-dependent epimerase/dehydratase family protein [Acidobacteriota bacterium]